MWNITPLSLALEDDKASIHWPDQRPLAGDPENVTFPFFLVGDDAFAAKEHLIKPISKRDLDRRERNFNKRVSRARRVSENCFGVMACRWRCLFTEIQLSPANVRLVAVTLCVLHNMVRDRCMITREPSLPQCKLMPDGRWRHLAEWQSITGRRENVARRVQETLMNW